MEQSNISLANINSKITVLGSANYDTVIFLQRPPEMGETISATDLKNACGGKGANQAVSASKLGYKVDFVGQFGNDSPAEILKNEMKNENVNLEKTQTLQGESTGQAFIFLYPSKDNSIVIVGGANMNWSQNDLSQLKESLESCKLVIKN